MKRRLQHPNIINSFNNKKRKRYKVRRNFNKTKQCLICMSDINENDIINIHKNHFVMCKSCLIEQAKVLLKNRDLLPWKCSDCQENLSLDILKNVMKKENYNKLIERQMETIIGKTISCITCDTTYCIPNDLNDGFIVCNLCNSNISLENKTNEENNQNVLLNLANLKNWAQCPGCHDLIEKIDGCNSMTHRENNGTITKFCYQCNERLVDDDRDRQGRHHFLNGSFNDCINTNTLIPNEGLDHNIIDEIININYVNWTPDLNNWVDIDYNNFNWERDVYQNNDSLSETDESLYYCTECDYYGYSNNALQQHINAKGHQEKFHCPECNYYGYSEDSLFQHQIIKKH